MGYKLMTYGGYFLFCLFFLLMDGWRGMGICLIIVGLALLALEPYKIKAQKNIDKLKENAETLKYFDVGFNPDNFFNTYKTKIAFKESDSLVKIYQLNRDGHIEQYTIPFSNIIESEITLDNQMISKVSKSGIVAGGLLAGGIGAAIGGLSASSIQNEMVKSVTLKITVEDLSKPIHYIDFLPTQEVEGYNTQGYKKDSNTIQQALKNAEYWHGVMDVIIKKANKVAQ
ncbi:immunity protein [Bacillus inaquosorum]|uniref:immunity protein n=1 Tax=Bacillus subtilis group TaxID=653685 RepID=UPI001C213A13|nr:MULTISPECIES: immunity protein [Bacillus subtilis group]MBU8803427.1 immunity protein [Bacillus subtilis]MCY7757888.1 immunity protein [Bacillus inaquosorum]MCY7943972.1 immunity protein [Bacillus inaquosorum]MCY7977396.1 immunity protein [Bacillus inaquosorum]MCY8083085.1 immunity protein [Bacillus inaquosorum]